MRHEYAVPELIAALIEILKLSQVHDSKTGYFARPDPYDVAKIARAALAKSKIEP